MNTDILEPQAVCSPITSSAIFIVATLNAGPEAAETVKDWCGDVAGLVRSVDKRVPTGIACLAIRARRRCTAFASSAGKGGTRRRPRAICCYTFAPIKWTCVLNWPRKSWRFSARR